MALAVEYLPWLLSVITIYMTILAGNNDPMAWIVGMFGQAAWLFWIIASEAWGLVPMNIVLWGLYGRNLRKWLAPQEVAT